MWALLPAVLDRLARSFRQSLVMLHSQTKKDATKEVSSVEIQKMEFSQFSGEPQICNIHTHLVVTVLLQKKPFWSNAV